MSTLGPSLVLQILDFESPRVFLLSLRMAMLKVYVAASKYHCASNGNAKWLRATLVAQSPRRLPSVFAKRTCALSFFCFVCRPFNRNCDRKLRFRGLVLPRRSLGPKKSVTLARCILHQGQSIVSNIEGAPSLRCPSESYHARHLI